MKVVAVGENIIDDYYNIKEQYVGGNCINFLINLKRNSNFELSYVGPVANDEEGNGIKKLLYKEGIGCHKVSYFEGKTARSYIKIVDGERYFSDFQPGVLENFKLQDHQQDFIKDQNHIHSSIMGGTLPFLGDLKGEGTLSFDFSKLNNINLLKSVASLVDYAFLSREELGENEKNLMKDMYLSGSKNVILLLGEKGSAVYDGDKIYEKDSMVKGDIVDSLGAGDAYIAGYMEKILSGYDIETAMEQGSILSANTCAFRGGFSQ